MNIPGANEPSTGNSHVLTNDKPRNVILEILVRSCNRWSSIMPSKKSLFTQVIENDHTIWCGH